MNKDNIIIFRCDGNSEIGMGHIVGCIRFAKLIKKKLSVNSIFLIKEDNKISKFLSSNGFLYSSIPHEANVEDQIKEILILYKRFSANAIVFNFNADELNLWGDKFLTLKNKGIKIIFQDNPMQSYKYGNIVINALPHPEYEEYYPLEHPSCFDGLEYLLLGDDYYPLINKARVAPPEVKRILIAMGGGDNENITSTILKILSDINCKSKVDVVVGAAYRHLDELKKIIDNTKLNIELSINVSNMNERIDMADIGFSSIGLTTYEMAALNLPCFIIAPHALNAKVAEIYEKKYSMAKYGGLISNISYKQLRNDIESFLFSSNNFHMLNNKIDIGNLNYYKNILLKMKSLI
jgi:spore coat polysaccharide biosynthesis predicted glycosyltransferase SpsG